MPPPTPDRELRRLVAELASTTTEDVEAVLDGLEGGHRRRVAELLTAYLGGETPAPAARTVPPVRPPAPQRLPGLSPWLARRLGLAGKLGVGSTAAAGWRGPPARGPVVGMTPTALRALAAAAAGLAPSAATPSLRDRFPRLRRRPGIGP